MPVTISWDSDEPLTGQPDAGSASKVYTEAGPGTVTVVDEAIGGPSRTLTYTVPLGLTTVVPDPAELDSAGTVQQRTATIAGQGFPASTAGTVAIATGPAGAYGTTVAAVGATTNTAGIFTGAAVTIPADTAAGDYHVEATFGPVGDLAAALTVVNTELAAPTNVQSPSQTSSTIEVTWTAVADAEQYVVEWAPNGTINWNQRPAVNAPATTDTITGLNPETLYDIRVKATATGSTDSPWSSPILTVSTGVQPQMDTPTGLATGATTTNSISLTWNAVTTPVAAGSYTLGWREPAGTWTEIPDITTTNHTVTGLTPLTDYEFRIKAVADGHTDSAWSTPPVSGSTQSLGTLTTPTAAAGTITATSVEITWGAVTDAEQYVVRWDESGQTNWNEEPAVAAPALADVVENLTTSQAYDFQVQARATGWSPSNWSNTVTATPA